jgi:hypothetical protein
MLESAVAHAVCSGTAAACDAPPAIMRTLDGRLIDTVEVLPTEEQELFLSGSADSMRRADRGRQHVPRLSWYYELKQSFQEAIGPQWGELSIGHLYQVLDRPTIDQ